MPSQVRPDVALVWSRARIAPGLNPDQVRLDPGGKLIALDCYLIHSSQYGWEIKTDGKLAYAVGWETRTAHQCLE